MNMTFTKVRRVVVATGLTLGAVTIGNGLNETAQAETAKSAATTI
jgi:hypothetical protein